MTCRTALSTGHQIKYMWVRQETLYYQHHLLRMKTLYSKNFQLLHTPHSTVQYLAKYSTKYRYSFTLALFLSSDCLQYFKHYYSLDISFLFPCTIFTKLDYFQDLRENSKRKLCFKSKWQICLPALYQVIDIRIQCL